MVLWLLESGTQDLAAKDVYGNTLLHYLASTVQVSEELIEKLRAKEGGSVCRRRARMSGVAHQRSFWRRTRRWSNGKTFGWRTDTPEMVHTFPSP
ncbi:hypothetical protein BDQ12DRAFT_690779 [Crucibulum laeve]|uniref:Ankyrin repeat-containing domain protein n=1 Tax=Crucibulum laeve TaxID=68775 RepID=A0A5C3LNY8_9AGAR|nr:hypothetical protein BDQ12DRAFT_690779 [Crucibulum laeve]